MAHELIDFLKFNVQYMTQLYREQPESSTGIWNRMEHRPLEGFVFITPLNSLLFVQTSRTCNVR